MRIGTLILLPFCTLLAFAGCDKRTSIGGGYELISGPSLGPDSHPGVALGFNGKKVWPNIDIHTFVFEQDASHFVHEDMFVFLMSIPDNDAEHYRYEISPQVCAIRGSAPPIVLSQQILGHLIQKPTDGVVCKLVPTAAGIHVEFALDADDTDQPTSTHDITWQQISTWLDTPESAAPRIAKPLGTYRILPSPPGAPQTQPMTRKRHAKTGIR